MPLTTAVTAKVFVLSIIHMADLYSPNPDKIQPVYAYTSLDECWRAAEVHIAEMAYDAEEAIAICTEGRP